MSTTITRARPVLEAGGHAHAIPACKELCGERGTVGLTDGMSRFGLPEKGAVSLFPASVVLTTARRAAGGLAVPSAGRCPQVG